MEFSEFKQEMKSFPTRGITASPQLWLEEKKARDTQLWGNDSSKFWIVKNKLYDLSNFADQHPGGPHWLRMTQGQDVTEMFFTHHLNEKRTMQTMSKYYVGQTKNDVVRFSFQPEGLYQTVKKRVLSQMAVSQILNQDSSKKSGVIIITLLLLFVFATAFSINLAHNSLISYGLASCCSVILLGVIGIGHNFVHHRKNVFKYVLNITGFTHTEWEIAHCISHHAFVNTELDFDAGAFQPFIYMLKSQPKNHWYTQLLVSIVYIVSLPINTALKLIVDPIIEHKKPDYWSAGPLIILLIFYAICGNFWTSLRHYCFIYGLLGYLYNRVLGCGHREEQLWTQGEERILDFGEHIMYTTSDTDHWVPGLWSYLFLAGFNMHTAHHFFPTADHAAHPRIHKIIDEVCQEMGVRHTINSRISCFKSISRGIVQRVPFKKT